MQFYTLRKQLMPNKMLILASTETEYEYEASLSEQHTGSLLSAALAVQRNVFLSVTWHYLRGQRSHSKPPSGVRSCWCALQEIWLNMSRARTVKGWTVYGYKSSLMISDAADTEHRVYPSPHPSPQQLGSSAGIIILPGHALILPTSASDLSLLTPEINLFWISQENIVDEQLISSRRALSRACLIYTLRVVSSWNWRRMEWKIKFSYFPHKISHLIHLTGPEFRPKHTLQLFCLSWWIKSHLRRQTRTCCCVTGQW